MLLLLFFYFALRTQIYPGICVWLSKLPNVNVWRTFFLAASLSPKFPRKSKIPPSNLKYFVPGNAYGIARQPLALLTILYGILNANQLLKAQQKSNRGMPIYRLLSRYTSFWRKTMLLFLSTKFLMTYVFSSSNKKTRRNTYNHQAGRSLTHYIHDHVCTYHRKK